MKWLKQFLNTFNQLFNFQKDQKKGKDNKATPFHLFILVAAIGVSLMLIGNMFSSSKQSNNLVQSAFSQKTTGAKTGATKASQSVSASTASAFAAKNAKTPDSMKAYEQDYENRLKDILDQVTGISNVSVMVNLSTSPQKILNKDVSTNTNTTNETDSNNGKRQVTQSSHDEKTIMVGSGSSQKPVIIGVQKPKIDGVLVVAEGAQNIQVKSWIVNAVSSVLNVPAYKVYVLPRKSKGE